MQIYIILKIIYIYIFYIFFGGEGGHLSGECTSSLHYLGSIPRCILLK